jgi:hypothetical protein
VLVTYFLLGLGRLGAVASLRGLRRQPPPGESGVPQRLRDQSR